MKTITVLKAFVLTLADHTLKRFETGVHEVDADIADHWYVKAHSAVEAAVKAAEHAGEKDAAALKAEAEAAALKSKADAEAEAAALKARGDAEAAPPAEDAKAKKK